MKPTEFNRWVDSARELAASHVEVRRARQSGGTAATVFVLERLEGLDVDRLVERMREDVASKHRRLSRATFDVLAFRLEGKDRHEVLRDVVVVTRDDDEAPPTAGAEVTTVEGASVEMQRAAFAAAREAHRDLRDMAVSMGNTMMSVAENLSARLVESQEKVAQQLAVAFEFASLHREREEDARASSERRELGKAAIQEFAPIAGSIVGHVMKNATPAWAGFAKRLESSGKLERVLAIVADDPELMAALGSAMDLTFPDPKKKQEQKKEEPNVESAG